MLSLTTHVEVHPTPAAAREIVLRLLADGTPPTALQLLRGRPTHDVRDQPVGGFADPIAPDAPVGTFAERTVSPRHSAGGWVGARNGRRRGSFGDVEQDELVTIDRAGRAVRRTVDRRALRRVLRPVAADRAASDRLVAELHQGHALLLQVTRIDSSDTSTEQENAPLAA